MVRSVLRHKETQVVFVNVILINVILFFMIEQDSVVSPLHATFSIATIVVLLLAVRLLKTHPSVIWQASCALIAGFLIPLAGLLLQLGVNEFVFSGLTNYKWLIVGLTAFNTFFFRWLEKDRFTE